MASILNNLRQKDDISQINYEDLERRFNIYKYYPKFFHNEEVKTPVIKSMIEDKPIYSKANEHLKGFVNPGVMKVYETELDLSSGKLRITKESKDDRREHRREKREDRKDRREERKEDRRERREERRDERRDKNETRERKQSYTSTSNNTDLLLENLHLDEKQRRIQHKRSKIQAARKLKERQKLIESKEKPLIRFNNPFDNQDSLMSYNNYQHEHSDESSMRKNSITSKLRSFMSNNSDELHLNRTNSYDQTKSVMTTGRKKNFFKKRYSEQIGMYNSEKENRRKNFNHKRNTKTETKTNTKMNI